MKAYFVSIDLKVVLFALLGCFAVPWLVLGTISLALSDATAVWASGATMVIFFLSPPLLAGYFTAKYAKVLPQFHVVLVGLLGLVASMMLIRASWEMYLGLAVLFGVLLTLGAFMSLRGRSRNAG
jgi:hypothetical protein